MRKILLLLFAGLGTIVSQAQKKPLNHSVYDGWQSAGERQISDDGRYLAYTINPQEGDGMLYVRSFSGDYQLQIPRGYRADFTRDEKYLVCLIKPFYKDIREAKIKKKKPDDMPVDSLAIIALGSSNITKIARVKSYKLPSKGSEGFFAYLLARPLVSTEKKQAPDSLARLQQMAHIADSLSRMADSLRQKLAEAKASGLNVLKPQNGGPKKGFTNGGNVQEGTELVWFNPSTSVSHSFSLIKEYYFSETGNTLVLVSTAKKNDSLVKPSVIWVNTKTAEADTVMKNYNDVANIAIDEKGTQLAFTAERDSAQKALQKFYRLWYYRTGMDSAVKRVDRFTTGIPDGFTVSPYYNNRFSKDGEKLFFGIGPIWPPRDTSLVDFETARLDIWNYKDDYLQPQQLVRLQRELKSSYAAVLNGASNAPVLLGAKDAENISLVDEGNAGFVLATSTYGHRVEAQWQGYSLQTAYLVSTADGKRRLVNKEGRAYYMASPNGKYVVWYDMKARQYFSYSVETGNTQVISDKIPYPLWDVLDDHPSDPPPYGMGPWTENDGRLLLYDRYDIWAVDPAGKEAPVNLTQSVGRLAGIELRYRRLDNEERFIRTGQTLLLSAFNQQSRYAGFYQVVYGKMDKPRELCMLPNTIPSLQKAKNSSHYLLQLSDINASELYTSADLKKFGQISDISRQQEPYNWLSVELKKWTMFDGRESEGLLFKPANFDSTKKYPVIFYFYERNADGLYLYRTPAPSASTINIPWFVSNGYLVFVPDIWYKDGEPGESAYNSVVSAAKWLSGFSWVDSTKMAIQGQSWGGYQVAYLVTRTSLFAAAGAGAPVANMTSAYGGIRWGTGLNRQFQYERTQSRIGATLWERPDLYIKNSPLFQADKVTTPLLIMHNDKDGSVPWYQGIEYFTALRRLGKKVWMLEYNGEDHNLVERRNRKDLSIRLSQFFDHFLKGAPATKWIAEGVPATLKGIDWGIE